MALKAVDRWRRGGTGKQIFRLFGYAGTGKTHLAKHLTQHVPGRVMYGAYTGKAALQLRRKGCADAQTLHSMIYKPEEDEWGDIEYVLNEDCDLAKASLLVVDEVSMVDEWLAKDLMSFSIPILVLGDPAQLPPVGGAGYFINHAPDIMLTDIRRQAADNPITRFSIDVREGRPLERGTYGSSRVISRADVSQDELRAIVMDADQMLCGRNKSRVMFNTRIRELKGLIGHPARHHPVIGDRLICLRNERKKKLFNGGLWDVESAEDKIGRWALALSSQDEPGVFADVEVSDEFFNGKENELKRWDRKKSSEFTYGWAITVHKSQGSEWPKVIVFDESKAFRDSAAQWLYTAITRAAESVVVVQP